MEKSLTIVLARFPEYFDQILDLFEKDETFRELCEDYFISSEAVTDHKVNAIKNQGFEMHYLHVFRAFENEIKANLKIV